MWRFLRRLLVGAVLAVLLLVAVVGSGLASLDLGFLKAALSEEFQRHTGLQLAVGGTLRLWLGPSPKVIASDIRLANGPDPVLSVQRAVVRPRFWNTVRGDVDIRGFRLDGLELAACEIGECGRPGLPQEWNASGEAPLGRPVRLVMEAALAGGALKLEVRGGALAGLLNASPRYPVSVGLTLPGAEARLEGQLLQPGGDAPRADLAGELAVRDAGATLSSLGIGPPATGASAFPSLEARVALDGGLGDLRLRELSGSLGKMEFALAGAARWNAERPRLELSGELGTVDVNELAGPFASSDNDPVGITLTLLLEALQAFDAVLDLQARELVIATDRFEALSVRAVLEDGRLDLPRLALSAGSQAFDATAQVNTRADCPALQAHLRIDGLDPQWIERSTGQPLPALEGVDRVDGHWWSCGATLDAHRESARLELLAEGLAVRGAAGFPPLEIDRAGGQLAWQGNGELEFSGRIGNEEASGYASFGPLASLASGHEWPIDANLEGSAARLRLAGHLARGAGDEPGSLDLAIGVEAAQLSRLAGTLGIPLHGDLPLALDGRVRHQEGGAAKLDLASARLGGSDLSGAIEWADPGSGAPVRARLSSGRIDVDELDRVLPAEEAAGTAPRHDGREKWAARLPDVTLDWQAGRVVVGRFEASEVYFAGVVHAEGVRDARLGLSIAERQIEGELDLDFARSPAELSFEFELKEPDIGALLSAFGLAWPVEATARSAAVHMETRGDSARGWLEHARAGIDVRALTWRFDGAAAHALQLETLQIDFRPEADSELRGEGALDGLPLRLWLRSPPLETVLDTNRPLPLAVSLGTAADITLLEAQLDRSDPDRLLADLVATAQSLDGSALPGFDALAAPDADLRATAAVELRPRQLRLDPVSLQAGDSRIEGLVDLVKPADRLAVTARLSSPFVETEDFVPLIARWQDASGGGGPAEAGQGEAAPEGSSILTLVDRELARLQAVDFDVLAEVAELRSAGKQLGRSRLEFVTTQDSLAFDLEADGPGGALTADYSWFAVPDGWEMDLSARAERLEFGGLLRLFNAESTASGELFLEADLSSRLAEPSQVLDRLEGRLDLLALPREVGAGWLDLWASNLLIALLDIGDDSRKKMNCLVARFEVEDGVMRSKKTFLDTTDIIVRARGEIDLGKNQLDLLLAPQAKRERFLSIQAPVEVTGPLDDFEVRLASGSFLATIVRWYYGVIYVPWKWLTGQRFPADGMATCYDAMGWPQPGGRE